MLALWAGGTLPLAPSRPGSSGVGIAIGGTSPPLPVEYITVLANLSALRAPGLRVQG